MIPKLTFILNMDYTYLNKISPERAIRLIKKERVTVEKESDTIWRSAKEEIFVPLIIRLTYLVRSVYKRGVQWSKRNVMIRDNFTCVYCGKDQKRELNIDHVHPSSRGGKNSFDNTVTSCKKCNERKDDKTLYEANMFYKDRRYKPYQPTIAEFTQKLIKSMGINDLIKGIFD